MSKKNTVFMFKCPSCSMEIPTDSHVCEYCGWIPPNRRPENMKKKTKNYTVIFMIMFLIFAVYIISNRNQEDVPRADGNAVVKEMATSLNSSGVSAYRISIEPAEDPYDYHITITFEEIPMTEILAKSISEIAISGAISSLEKQGILPNEERVSVYVHIYRTYNSNPIYIGMGSFETKYGEFAWDRSR